MVCHIFTDKSDILQSLPPFYRDIIKEWIKIRRINKNGDSLELKYILNECIWFNEYITIEGKPLLWKGWFNKGIKQIKDLLNDKGHFLDSFQLNEKFGIQSNFLQTLQLRKALPFCWRKKLLNIKQTLNKSYIPIFEPNSLSFKNLHNITTKELYWILWKHLKPKGYTPASIRKWNEIFTLQIEDWANIFKTPYLTFRGVFYQCFQYKISHRIIACRDWLSTLKVIDSPSCLYCDDKDTILHFFVYCPLVTEFWSSFMPWWNKLVNACASLDEIIIIFGVRSTVMRQLHSITV